MTSLYKELIFTLHAKPTFLRSCQRIRVWGTDITPCVFRDPKHDTIGGRVLCKATHTTMNDIRSTLQLHFQREAMLLNS
jgi:hypothetical protein